MGSRVTRSSGVVLPSAMPSLASARAASTSPPAAWQGAAQLQNVPACRLAAEVVIECEYAMNFGAGQIQRRCNHGYRRLRHIAEGFLNGVKDDQCGTFDLRVPGYDLGASLGVPRFVNGHRPHFRSAVSLN